MYEYWCFRLECRAFFSANTKYTYVLTHVFLIFCFERIRQVVLGGIRYVCCCISGDGFGDVAFRSEGQMWSNRGKFYLFVGVAI